MHSTPETGQKRRSQAGRALESGVWLFAQPTCHRAPEVHSAVGETEATGLLREFFRATR
jgi:tRNA(adenine34) deaminase